MYRVKSKHREAIEFIDQDLRSEMPAHHFDLILCQYVAFTYFAIPLQRQGMLERLRPNGYFVIGAEEKLPGAVPEVSSFNGEPHIFQKIGRPQQQGRPSALGVRMGYSGSLSSLKCSLTR